VSRGVKAVVEQLIRLKGLRMVVEGDGLNNLSGLGFWPAKREAKLVLTPHPGEFGRLWSGLSREPKPEGREEQAGELARQTDSVVVLKGAGTVVSDGERVYVNETGNPGMATAGAGDVLTGVITALMGQGLSEFDAAVLGTAVHGLAGDIGAQTKGEVCLMATDIIDCLPEASNALNKNS
jgi:NAD(P)H-hydrate epimerase